MDRSPGFGSTATDYALFRLAFASAPGLRPLTMPVTVTRRFILQKARTHARTALVLLVGTRFQGLFHSAPAVLFTFPSRYWFTIGRQAYLALEGGPPGFPRDSSCPVVLGIRLAAPRLSPTGLLPSVAGLSRPVRLDSGHRILGVPQPQRRLLGAGLGSSPFARRY